MRLIDDALSAGRDAAEHTLEQTELFQRYMELIEQELTGAKKGACGVPSLLCACKRIPLFSLDLRTARRVH